MLSDNDGERFWSKVNRHPDGCWDWTGIKDVNGYGRFSVKNVSAIASRVAAKLTKPEFTPSDEVMHKCDHPGCVRPSHLELGTHAKNQRDMSLRGRSRGPIPPGEDCPASKLTGTQVLEIRERCDNGEPQRSIAKSFGIAQATVGIIHRRQTWRHI